MGADSPVVVVANRLPVDQVTDSPPSWGLPPVFYLGSPPISSFARSPSNGSREGLFLVGGLFFFNFGRTSTSKADLSYSQFQKAVDNGTVQSVEFDPTNGKITGTFKTAQGGKKEFTSSGPNNDFQATEIARLQAERKGMK